MSIRAKQTDQARRLALQIAAQLPEDIAEARVVIEETTSLLDGYLIRGPHEVIERRRALVLPDRQTIAAAALFWTSALFLLLAPLAVGAAHVVDVRAAAAYVFAAGVVACAITFGRAYGTGFAVAAAIVYNLFVVAPITEFSWPLPVEIVAFSGNLLLAFAAPALAQHAPILRRGAAISAGAIVPAPRPAGLSQD